MGALDMKKQTLVEFLLADIDTTIKKLNHTLNVRIGLVVLYLIIPFSTSFIKFIIVDKVTLINVAQLILYVIGFRLSLAIGKMYKAKELYINNIMNNSELIEVSDNAIIEYRKMLKTEAYKVYEQTGVKYPLNVVNSIFKEV
jgi:hypothetical protein